MRNEIKFVWMVDEWHRDLEIETREEKKYGFVEIKRKLSKTENESKKRMEWAKKRKMKRKNTEEEDDDDDDDEREAQKMSRTFF